MQRVATQEEEDRRIAIDPAPYRLPFEERAPHRAKLLALLLDTRRSDGSFLDTPVLGPTSGTALALEALRWLAATE